MSDIKWCIDYLAKYNNVDTNVNMSDEALFRALLNITMPYDLSDEYYVNQDAVLKEILSRKEIVDVSKFKKGISIYKGDITLLKSDAIVDACNEKMLGCFIPGHHCIDNAIHSFAGLQVRRDMMEIMEKQGHDEPSGQCKVTKAYNLPSNFIFHTVGPIYSGSIQDNTDLENCYLACLKEAKNRKLKSIVFCSLSTGIYGFPIEKACRIAISTVKNYLGNNSSSLENIIFDVFSEGDYEVYNRAIKEFD